LVFLSSSSPSFSVSISFFPSCSLSLFFFCISPYIYFFLY
jgi:hypothetical protein